MLVRLRLLVGVVWLLSHAGGVGGYREKCFKSVAILAQGDVAVNELEGVPEKTAAIAQAALLQASPRQVAPPLPSPLHAMPQWSAAPPSPARPNKRGGTQSSGSAVNEQLAQMAKLLGVALPQSPPTQPLP